MPPVPVQRRGAGSGTKRPRVTAVDVLPSRAAGSAKTNGGKQRAPISGRRARLSEEVLVESRGDDAGGDDDRFSIGIGSDEDGGAAEAADDTPALTLEESETADERRLRIAHEYLRRMARATAAGGAVERNVSGIDDDNGNAHGRDVTGSSDSDDGAVGAQHDAVSARLRDEALAASGALFRPVAATLGAIGFSAADVVFVRGHNVSGESFVA